MSSPQDLTKQANKVRLSNKNSWYQITFENETSGECTRLKCFGTWVQMAEFNAFNTTMDQTAGQFKENITNGLKALIEKY